MSGQPCGCDPEAHYLCDGHKIEFLTNERDFLATRVGELENLVRRTRAVSPLPDESVGKLLHIVTGTCHFNHGGWCLDHKGGRDVSSFCTEAHRLAKEAL